MYEFTCSQPNYAQSRVIWSRTLLEPLADLLTPFSYSVLAEMSGRAWFHYYDQLGADLPLVPRSLTRSYKGRPYLNLRWICEQDAAFAGLEPLTLWVNGQPLPVCQVEKAGFLAGFRQGRRQKRIRDLLARLDAERDEITAAARSWFDKVTSMKWSQAEILQVMEEIERVGAQPLMFYYAARHNLERAYNGLLGMMRRQGIAADVQLVNAILADLQNLVELDLTSALLALAQLAQEDEVLMIWLEQADFTQWTETVPEGPFSVALLSLIRNFGHRAVNEGELAHPRWFKDPTFLFKGILACAKARRGEPARVPSKAAHQQLLESFGADDREQAGQLIEDIRALIVLQSHALNALAYILAGARAWALAAGREAHADGRLQTVDQVFLFELEEIKQMMTGEWNVSSLEEIQARAARRQEEYEQWRESRPGELLFDDAEAFSVRSIPGSKGQVTGPLRRKEDLEPCLCENAVVGAGLLDSGWAPTLPVAGGLLAAAGTPIDPIAAAARFWHVPMVIGIGQEYDALVEGAQTTLDGETGAVEQ